MLSLSRCSLTIGSPLIGGALSCLIERARLSRKQLFGMIQGGVSYIDVVGFRRTVLLSLVLLLRSETGRIQVM